MRLQLENTELLLQENRLLGLVNGKGLTIRCTSGLTWLTVAGEAGDCYLAAGQSHRLASDGLALVEALGKPAAIRIEAPCPAPARLWRRLTRLFRPRQPSAACCPQ